MSPKHDQRSDDVQHLTVCVGHRQPARQPMYRRTQMTALTTGSVKLVSTQLVTTQLVNASHTACDICCSLCHDPHADLTQC